MRSNQRRLLFSTMADLLHHALRELGLAGTEMAQAGTIRTKLLKIGGRLRVRVRRVWLSLSESSPSQESSDRILPNLQQQRPPPLTASPPSTSQSDLSTGTLRSVPAPAPPPPRLEASSRQQDRIQLPCGRLPNRSDDARQPKSPKRTGAARPAG